MRFMLMTGLAFAFSAGSAVALTFDQNVTNNVIFGSGNVNGFFTVDQQSGVELGLRAKLRFDGANQPQNIFNSNGAGTYTFLAGQAAPGFGFAQDDPGTPIWNFEWSINSNFDGNGGVLDGLTYRLDMDFDPGAGTNNLSFDPIIIPAGTLPLDWADHAIGDNSTANGAGTTAVDRPTYLSLLAANNLAQNSWSYQFFNDGAFAGFDANDQGVYTISLTALSGGTTVASTTINVNAVPEPASMLLGMMGCAAVAGYGFRRPLDVAGR